MDLWCRAASGISGSACCFCTRTTPLRPTAANLTAQSGQLFAYHSGARYDELSALLQQELLAQDEFTLPNIHYPKIINMLLLCISRKKYAAEAAFSGEQQTVLQASAEYKFICRLHCRLPEHFRQAVQ